MATEEIMVTEAEMRTTVAGFEGWLRPAQASRLWELAKRVDADATVVEIGSYQGKSTVALALGAPSGAHIYAIDPHAGNDRGPGEWDGAAADGESDHQAFKANLTAAGVVEKVEHIREFSDDAHGAVLGDIDLLYVDGAHGYRPALSDITGWGDRVVGDGTMAIHDVFTSVFVTLAVARSLFWSRKWRYVGRVRSMAVYERTELGLGGRISNFGRQFAQLPWFAYNTLIRGLLVAHLAPLTRLLGHDPANKLF